MACNAIETEMDAILGIYNENIPGKVTITTRDEILQVVKLLKQSVLEILADEDNDVEVKAWSMYYVSYFIKQRTHSFAWIGYDYLLNSL